MRDFEAQLLAVLRVYLERGLFALDALTVEDDDQVVHWMRLRKAAFHNLLALDHEAVRVGFIWDNSPTIKALNQKLTLINSVLEARIAKRIETAKDELNKMRGVKKNLGKFHSGAKATEVFSKAV